MIEKLEVIRKANALKLRHSTLEKDYVLGWILMGVANNPKTRNSWIFKGGTCLKKCFFDEYRFSEDLDFTLIDNKNMQETYLQEILNELAQWVYEHSGINIPEKSISVQFYRNLQGFISACAKLAYFGPLQPKQKNNLPTIKLDLTLHEKVVLAPESRALFHPYADKPMGDQIVSCYCFEEIFAEKFRALAERARPRDLYDVVCLYHARHLLIEKNSLFKSVEQKCAFKKMGIPDLKTIQSHPQRTTLSSEWKNMLGHQLPKLKPFEDFWNQLPHVFDWFYAGK